ncbi:MAG: hypothetical protein MUC38_09790 [Cyclobacteriaceae bacterium]|jgi:hypothetical protein|nr:hypothetical protein [Cyclobacteriaceae bacterium]
MGIDNEPLASLLERAEQYAKTTLELWTLKAIHKTADIASSLVAHTMVFVIGLFAMVIIHIGLALWIGGLLGGVFYGFFVVGGFYLALSGLLYRCRSTWIKRPVSDAIVSQLIKSDIE